MSATPNAVRIKKLDGSWQDIAIIGPQGDKGDPGTTGEDGAVVVYVRPDEPPAGEVGELWIDTDAAPPGSSGATGTRTSTRISTGSLATNASQTMVWTIAHGVRLIRMTTSRAARVRVYATAAHRDADLSRPVGTPATGDHGLMLELVTTAGVLDYRLAPPPEVHADTADIPLSVVNLGATGVVDIDVIFMKTEN